MPKISKIVIAIGTVALLGACGGSNSSDTQLNQDAGKSKKAAVDTDQYSAGIFKADVNGKRHIWKIDTRQSDWFSGLEATSTYVSIYSLRAADNPYPGNLSASLTRGPAGWRASEITLYSADPEILSFSSSNDGDTRFEVSSAKMEGDKMKITGSFSAAMPALYRVGQDPDMSNILDVKNGTFDIALPPRGN